MTPAKFQISRSITIFVRYLIKYRYLWDDPVTCGTTHYYLMDYSHLAGDNARVQKIVFMQSLPALAPVSDAGIFTGAVF